MLNPKSSIKALDWANYLIQMKLHSVQPVSDVPGLVTPLRPYQMVGVGKILECWKERQQSCILADEMGLGKTLQSISAVLVDKEHDHRPACFSLIVTTKQ